MNTPRLPRTLSVWLLPLALGCSSSPKQQAATKPPAEEKFQLKPDHPLPPTQVEEVVPRIYDVHELITDPDGRVSRDKAQKLAARIRAGVAMDTWVGVGGSYAYGTIREQAGSFVIMQSPKNHEQIASLLDIIRRGADVPSGTER